MYVSMYACIIMYATNILINDKNSLHISLFLWKHWYQKIFISSTGNFEVFLRSIYTTVSNLFHKLRPHSFSEEAANDRILSSKKTKISRDFETGFSDTDEECDREDDELNDDSSCDNMDDSGNSILKLPHQSRSSMADTALLVAAHQSE